MKAPGPGTIASVVLHAGLGALLFFSGPDKPLPSPPSEGIRVSVISDVQVLAAAPDNPSEELIVDDGASAPPEPVEAPPVPEPTPTPPPAPRPAEKKAPTTPRTPPQRQPQPPRPPERQREEPSLDLDAMAKRRDGDRRRRPPTGDAGQGQAPRALGRADISALGRQVSVNCTPGVMQAGSIVVQVNVRLSTSGRLVGEPRLVNPSSNPAYRAMADSVLRGIRAAVPFDLPEGYEEQSFNFAFNSATAC